MAIGWLAALKLIPWSDVISNAPMVADGAKKLWSTVKKKPAPSEQADPAPQSGASAESTATAAMEARLAALDSAVSELHAQMVSSLEIIKTLAEQNSQLIVRIETNRTRILWLAGISAATAVVAVGSLVLLFVRN